MARFLDDHAKVSKTRYDYGEDSPTDNSEEEQSDEIAFQGKSRGKLIPPSSSSESDGDDRVIVKKRSKTERSRKQNGEEAGRIHRLY